MDDSAIAVGTKEDEGREKEREKEKEQSVTSEKRRGQRTMIPRVARRCFVTLFLSHSVSLWLSFSFSRLERLCFDGEIIRVYKK